MALLCGRAGCLNNQKRRFAARAVRAVAHAELQEEKRNTKLALKAYKAEKEQARRAATPIVPCPLRRAATPIAPVALRCRKPRARCAELS